jgi:hypothetical protein
MSDLPYYKKVFNLSSSVGRSLPSGQNWTYFQTVYYNKYREDLFLVGAGFGIVLHDGSYKTQGYLAKHIVTCQSNPHAEGTINPYFTLSSGTSDDSNEITFVSSFYTPYVRCIDLAPLKFMTSNTITIRTEVYLTQTSASDIFVFLVGQLEFVPESIYRRYFYRRF